jgi:hypothetical protein
MGERLVHFVDEVGTGRDRSMRTRFVQDDAHFARAFRAKDARTDRRDWRERPREIQR